MNHFYPNPQAKTSQELILIPAAGYGTRVGSPAAKELLPHPLQPEQSLMSTCLQLANQKNRKILVISRRDKTVLNQALYQWQESIPQLEVLELEQTQEWTDSILQAYPYRLARNLILLPDVTFSPVSLINQLFEKLATHPMALALFSTNDSLKNWGCVWQKKNEYYFCDKPKELVPNDRYWPWGLMAFDQSDGANCFAQYCQHDTWVKLPNKTALLHLNDFKDLTRPT